MRWEALFADLEAQLASADQRTLDGEIAERVRIEVGSVTLLDRVRARRGRSILVRAGGAALAGTVLDVGADYLLLATPGGQALVPVAAVDAIGGLGRQARREESAVRRRLGLRGALRGLARDRAPVRLVTRFGELSGLLARVAADHVDLVPATPGDADAGAAAAEAVSLQAIVLVRSGP